MKIGSLSIASLNLGSSPIDKIVLGSNQVYTKDNTFRIVTGLATNASTCAYQAALHVYEYEPGMTWAQWLVSAYNTDEWTLSSVDGNLVNSAYAVINYSNPNLINSGIQGSAIIQNATYYYMNYSGDDSETTLPQLVSSVPYEVWYFNDEIDRTNLSLDSSSISCSFYSNGMTVTGISFYNSSGTWMWMSFNCGTIEEEEEPLVPVTRSVSDTTTRTSIDPTERVPIEPPSLPNPGEPRVYVVYTTGSTEVSAGWFSPSTPDGRAFAWQTMAGDDSVYYGDSSAFRTILLTSPATGDLLNFLQNNATKL